MNRSRYNKLAEAAYDRVIDSANHDRFDIGDVVSEIVAELSSEQATADLIREFAQSLAEKADDRRAKRAESGQGDLLSGESEALDAVWRIGAGQRVRARDAQRREALAWLGIRGDNAARVQAAYEKDRKAVAELLVYMPDEETTVGQAVEKRKRAKP